MMRIAVTAAFFAWMIAAAGFAAAGETPRRVVSMNLCTDQLAIMLAEPGQVISVSYLASDKETSVMAAQAAGIPVNYGQAEEIFLFKPDLVLAGTFTTRATVVLLRRLGFRVEEFAPASSLDAVRANLHRMGEVLDRQETAAALRKQFDRRVAAVGRQAGDHRPTIAPFYANAYTSGADTLVDDVITAAGLTNLGRQLKLRGTAKLSIEVLLVSQPDLMMLGRQRGALPSQAHELLRHPVVEHVMTSTVSAVVPDRYLICGTPHTARAVELLAAARAEFLRSAAR